MGLVAVIVTVVFVGICALYVFWPSIRDHLARILGG